MSKHKLLIHWPVDLIGPTGGPPGYLFNLKKGLDSLGAETCIDFEFLPAQGSANSGVNLLNLLRKRCPRALMDYLRSRKAAHLIEHKSIAKINYNNYKIIHFHSTQDLYCHREALEEYKGVVLLTSHSPCVYHKELISKLKQKYIDRFANHLSRLSEIDRYAFNRADYVVFPCREAEEPYFHTWDEYEAIRDESKLCYLPTGIEKCNVKVTRGEIRKRFHIPENAFVLCYVGRHNQIKGYEFLLKAAPELLKDPNVWILVAGKEGPLYGPEHERWMEVGWTNDPHSLIAASDLFVLPNVETYFDLVLLEVLSLGVPILASRTGGNKYFEKFDSSGLELFSNEKEFFDSVYRIRSLNDVDRIKAGNDNTRLFSAEFTCEQFAERYCLLINEILSNLHHES